MKQKRRERESEKPTGTIERAGVYDIECADWTRFVVGRIETTNGDAVEHWNGDDFFDDLISREGAYWGHFGGRYDALWVLDQAEKRGISWTAKLRGAGVVLARVGNVELRDSFALIPMSLAKAAALAGRSVKLELGLRCDCDEPCGGYCGLSRVLSSAEKRLVSDYLAADCRVLLDVLEAVEAECSARDISIGLTMGASAWKTARDWLALPDSTHDLGRYREIRDGYFGGRTEAYAERAARGERYDIHSSYPAALARVALPYGETLYRRGSAASAAYRSGAEGVFRARVAYDCRETAPPLPYRAKERLLYPHGEFFGVWTGLELRHAESVGARILKVSSAYVWPKSGPILAPYAERVWRYRAEAAAESTAKGDRGSAWSGFFKLLANSLTGKLAQRPEKASLEFIAGNPPVVPDGAEIIRPTSRGVFISRESIRVDTCAHVQWAAYLTAEARTELHRQIRHVEATPGNRVLYCDTDSVYSALKQSRRIGPELGEWGHEGSLTDWQCLAPKVYRYSENGKVTVKGKGMSGLDSDGFDALASGHAWTVDRGVDGIRTRARASRGGLFVRRSLSRGLHPIPGWLGGRVLLSDGSTRSTSVDEYESR